MTRTTLGCSGALSRGWLDGEYLIVALPQFESPTPARRGSAAVEALNREGRDGWEALGMTSLPDGTVAVMLKRNLEDS